jgi:hypothetical protein
VQFLRGAAPAGAAAPCSPQAGARGHAPAPSGAWRGKGRSRGQGCVQAHARAPVVDEAQLVAAAARVQHPIAVQVEQVGAAVAVVCAPAPVRLRLAHQLARVLAEQVVAARALLRACARCRPARRGRPAAGLLPGTAGALPTAVARWAPLSALLAGRAGAQRADMLASVAPRQPAHAQARPHQQEGAPAGDVGDAHGHALVLAQAQAHVAARRRAALGLGGGRRGSARRARAAAAQVRVALHACARRPPVTLLGAIQGSVGLPYPNRMRR